MQAKAGWSCLMGAQICDQRYKVGNCRRPKIRLESSDAAEVGPTGIVRIGLVFFAVPVQVEKNADRSSGLLNDRPVERNRHALAHP
ncbi:hypothetical protein ATO3_10945 [Marinibacterium profundimaris]|uniref:Uncharacterized protein n=1 Tax=Marinibacterium profundimaris TaxID=1679460 RepID=A0A225NM86_9RHOB|nr:hypothetical protein ATO3_10945 [Marinibacterium profundimaris]